MERPPDPHVPAVRDDTVDVLHGERVPDPYRWLEDAGSQRTVTWSAAQDDLLAAWFAANPRREARRQHFASRIAALMPGFVGLPAAFGRRMFSERREPDQDHPVLLVDDGDGSRVLVDPCAMSPDHTTTLDGWWPSWEGDRLAYVVSEGGAEETVLWVLDVDTGAPVDGPVVCGRSADVAWLPGGEGFLYVRRLPDDRLPAGEGQFHRRVWWHRVGAPIEEDVCVFGEGRDKTAYYGVGISADGRWAIVSVSLGTAPRNDVYLADLSALDGRSPERGLPAWVAVHEGEDTLTDAHVAHDGRLYLHTNRDAPRYRLAVADPRSPAPDHWRDLVAQSDAVLAGYAVTDDAVVVVLTRDVVSEVDVRDRATGELRVAVSLPGLGSAAVTSRPAGGRDLWVSYTDHLTPPRVLHAAVSAVGGEALLERWADPPGAISFPGMSGRQEWVTSADGTRVPMFVVASGEPGARPEEPRPAILYGYGGFDIALTPAYSALASAWVEAGGVWAVANLRGGGEFGETWHRDGMRAAKQHVFEDFEACARALVDRGWARAAGLGIYGGSNGGLLVGAALTRHPERYAAVVCSAPLLDMVRYEQFGLGVTWNDEYGTAADPEELGWLLGYSPYHHVEEGTRYPATLFTVFDADTRVDPLHARKMCAALQWATAARFEEAPVLIRREANVGHATRSIGRTVALNADILAFFDDRLGLGPR